MFGKTGTGLVRSEFEPFNCGVVAGGGVRVGEGCGEGGKVPHFEPVNVAGPQWEVGEDEGG